MYGMEIERVDFSLTIKVPFVTEQEKQTNSGKC